MPPYRTSSSLYINGQNSNYAVCLLSDGGGKYVDGQKRALSLGWLKDNENRVVCMQHLDKRTDKFSACRPAEEEEMTQEYERDYKEISHELLLKYTN